MVHEVGYWATDAIPEDSRFYWKSYFTLRRPLPGRAALHPDLRRCGARQDLLALPGHQYLQARRWAWGVTDIPYVVQNAIRHREIPFWSRAWRVLNLFGEHINWAIAPFVIMFGATVPLLINPAFARDDARPEPAALRVDHALHRARRSVRPDLGRVPHRAAAAVANGAGGRASCRTRNGSACRSSGIFFSNLPALDAQTRLLTGRYLEYRVTEKV